MIARLLISRSQNAKVNAIKEELKINGLSKDHPDLLYFGQDVKLGIAEARTIKKHFALKPYSEAGRVVILEDASEITVEAQNALLKTLEELPEEAILILGANSDVNFLPTILSRCQIIRLSEADKSDTVKYADDIAKLLNSSIEERFGYIEKLKDKEGFLHFLAVSFRETLLNTESPANNTTKMNYSTVYCEASLRASSSVNRSSQNTSQLFGLRPQDRRLAALRIKDFLNQLMQAEKWAKQNVNIRAILEYLMLVMPRAR